MEIVVRDGRRLPDRDLGADVSLDPLWRFEAALPLQEGERLTLPDGEVVQVIGTTDEAAPFADQGLVVLRQYVTVGDLA